MQTQRLQLKRTISVDEIIYDSGARCEKQQPSQVIAYFKKWPIDEVRMACLKAMECSFRELEYLDWARETIEALIEVGDRDMALEVMQSYADAVYFETRDSDRTFSMYHDDVPKHLQAYGGGYGKANLWTELVKMLIFAARIGLTEFRRPMLKIVCRSVDPEEFPGCYHHEDLRFIKKLFDTTLQAIRGKYDESDWHCAARTLQVIAGAIDRSYVNQLKVIIAAHESGEAAPNFGIFSRVANLAVLKETLRILKQE